MPASVFVRYLANPGVEKLLHAQITRLMEQYPGLWRINIRGSGPNTIWEITVKDPTGQREWVRNLYHEDGKDDVSRVLAEVAYIVATQKAKSAAT
jgi:hypothetical protein